MSLIAEGCHKTAGSVCLAMPDLAEFAGDVPLKSAACLGEFLPRQVEEPRGVLSAVFSKYCQKELMKPQPKADKTKWSASTHRSKMEKKNKKRLGDVLVQQGSLTQHDLNRAVAMQNEKVMRLGEILLQDGFVSKTEIGKALEQVQDIAYAECLLRRSPRNPGLSAPIPCREVLCLALENRKQRISHRNGRATESGSPG